MPLQRMGPPPRSFAADAHHCIMVRVSGPPNTRMWHELVAPHAGSPPIVIPTTAVCRRSRPPRYSADGREVPAGTSVAACSKRSRDGLQRVEQEAGPSQRPPLTAPARAAKGPPCRKGSKGTSNGRAHKHQETEPTEHRGGTLDKKSPIQVTYTVPASPSACVLVTLYGLMQCSARHSLAPLASVIAWRGRSTAGPSHSQLHAGRAGATIAGPVELGSPLCTPIVLPPFAHRFPGVGWGFALIPT